ncbi:MAG: T9SS type A sorting domain-containing protein [Bacteroidetes bacterium]|nr:T9SS type A sorting domain-containing protein [Bacteroidota bacterium]
MICFCGTFLPNEIIVNTLNEKIQLLSDNYEWHIKAELNISSTLEIFDLAGKSIYKVTFFREIFLSKNNFQSGVYVFKVSNGNTSKQFKVILSN